MGTPIRLGTVAVLALVGAACRAVDPIGAAIIDGGDGCISTTAACAGLVTETDCVADSVDRCVWWRDQCHDAPDPACADGEPKQTCSCADGRVCVRRDDAPVACERPIAGCIGGSALCGCLAGAGDCVPARDIFGLCICTIPAPAHH